jgi:hypothetical protein
MAGAVKSALVMNDNAAEVCAYERNRGHAALCRQDKYISLLNDVLGARGEITRVAYTKSAGSFGKHPWHGKFHHSNQ